MILALNAFDPDPKTVELCLDICRRDHAINEDIAEIVNQLDSYDFSLRETWRSDGLLHKAGIYTVHYLLPLRELLLLQDVKSISLTLTAQLLSCMAWRTFDNCIDGHEHYRVAPQKSLTACLHLVEFIQDRFGQSITRELAIHYCTMTEQGVQEASAGIALEDIWRRCSILLLVPEQLARLEESSLNFYKKYLCYCGIAHDMNDLISDLACGIQSLPLEWLRESSEGILNIAALEAMERKARVAVGPLEEELARYAASNQLSIATHLMSYVGQVFHRTA